MKTKEEVTKAVYDYLQLFPEEHARLKLFNHFVDCSDNDALYSRKNFNGHITASAFIIDNSASKLLLLKHAFLNRWLQPGGHVDIADHTILAAAMREVLEETGIEEAQMEIVTAGTLTVFDIDSHLIPENIKKQEPAHYHHDVRFLLKCDPAVVLALNENEASELSWFDLDEVDNHLPGMKNKIKHFIALSQKH